MNKILMAGAALVMSSGLAFAQGVSSSSSTTTTTTTDTPAITVAPPASTTTSVDHTVSNDNGVMTERTQRSKVTTPSVVTPSVTQTTRTEKTTTNNDD